MKKSGEICEKYGISCRVFMWHDRIPEQKNAENFTGCGTGVVRIIGVCL
jgi:hypothetical protein